MSLRLSVLGITLLILAMFSGCSTQTNIPDEAAHQFVDIPVPQGFKLLDSSYTVEAKTIRSGTLRYSGDCNLKRLDRFYKKVMKSHDWELYNSETNNNKQLLYFRKERSVAVVCFYRELRVTYIDIEVR